MQESKVMVCVTGQKTCERLIREGERVAGERGGSVQVIHVATRDSAFLCRDIAQEAEALEYLFRCAQACGAEMCVLRSEDALQTLESFAKEHAITCVVLGVGTGRNALHFSEQLGALLPGVTIHPVYAQGEDA